MDLQKYVEENFPTIEPGFDPLGPDVLVQLRTMKTTTSTGIVLVEDTKQFNDENTMIGYVVKLGPLAYCNRDTQQPWPEGVWAKPGDIVLIPKWGGFRFERTLPDGNKTRFCVLKDHEIRGKLNEHFEALNDVR